MYLEYIGMLKGLLQKSSFPQKKSYVIPEHLELSYSGCTGTERISWRTNLNIQGQNFCSPFYLESLQSKILLPAHEYMPVGLRRKTQRVVYSGSNKEKNSSQRREHRLSPPQLKCSHNGLFSKNTASSCPMNRQTISCYHHHSLLPRILEFRYHVCSSILKDKRFWYCLIMPVGELSVDSAFQPSVTIYGLKPLI